MTEIQTNGFILNKNKNIIRNSMGTCGPRYAINYNKHIGKKRSELRLSDIIGSSKSVLSSEINYEPIADMIKNNNSEMSQNGASNNPEHIGNEPYLLNQRVLINFPNNQKTSPADNSSQQSDNFIFFQSSPRPKYCGNGSSDGQHKTQTSRSERENIENVDSKLRHDREVDESKRTSNDQSINDDMNAEHISEEPSHHARRPMNAFLIFCKRHRSVVRERYPSLENRAVTKILGEWWAQLDQDDKASYTALAKQYKDAFFSANPNFKWYKLPAPPLRTLNTRPGNISRSGNPSQATGPFSKVICADPSPAPSSVFTPGKLADETQLGNLNSLIDPHYNNKTDDAEKFADESKNFESEYTNINNNTLFDGGANKSRRVESSSKTASDEFGKYFQTPNGGNFNEKEIPPKPPKKRFIDEMSTSSYNNESAGRNTFDGNFQNDDSKIIHPSQPELYLRDASKSIENPIENVTSKKSPFFNLRTHAQSSGRPSSHCGEPNEVSDSDSDDGKSDFRCRNAVTEPKIDNGSESSNERCEKIKPENLTQQQLIDRVVDRMCSGANETFGASERETDSDAKRRAAVGRRSDRRMARTSVRSCKGKRYAEFMVESKLIVNKRGRKNDPADARTPGTEKSKRCRARQRRSPTRASCRRAADALSDSGTETLYIDLNETIQKLSNRTQNANSFTAESRPPNDRGTNSFRNCRTPTEPRKRTVSEASDDSVSRKMFRAADFNLNEKIEALPSLSLEKFQQKKKENKKKKRLVAGTKRLSERSGDSETVESCWETNNNVTLTGSRKRKARKQSITHLEVGNNVPATVSCSSSLPEDLFGLTTLAEVALNSDKLKADANNE